MDLYSNEETKCHLWRSPMQASILGPLLFSVFINDLPLALQIAVAVDFYADDTTFYDFQSDVY